MIGYNLPKLKLPKLKKSKVRIPKFWRDKLFWLFTLVIFTSSLFGFLAGTISGSFFYIEIAGYLENLGLSTDQLRSGKSETYIPQTSQEQAVTRVVKENSKAVVSIIISKDLPIIEEYYYSPFEDFFGDPLFDIKVPGYRQKGVEKKEVGGGTGFIISEDGMVLTNKHVVLDKEADYTILTSDGKRFSAQVLARDLAQDIAILKIKQEIINDDQGETILKPFPKVKLGDSDKIQIGQTVVAIGNVLARYQNTVSVGIVSGLGRTITASGGGFYETLEDVIQTDAAINRGNSGGPLLNLKGQVIGINTAVDIQGQNISFAILINKAKRGIEQVKTLGKIVYPFLGVRYVIINESIQKDNNLPVDYGALIVGSQGQAAIFPDSAAEKAGLKQGDIILEFNGEKITTENSLAKIIMKYDPGDEITLKILREKEKTIKVVLEGRSE
ncbi:MAG: trypsin-like peptidase domain-containing protein [Patescibacteria group bacterium]|nr:trypsin-like peptidase domain-containing protein [Patescibacteria group bacterium]